MVDVAQWLEHWIVVPGVVGSIPIFHPRNRSCISLVGFFVSIAAYRLVSVTKISCGICNRNERCIYKERGATKITLSHPFGFVNDYICYEAILCFSRGLYPIAISRLCCQPDRKIESLYRSVCEGRPVTRIPRHWRCKWWYDSYRTICQDL